ncbi:glycerophosphoryl diester phosphodiesterase membrane domain-containing protein [Streptomyces sp. NPDC053431]|uniref:glycerophosphoryl diester phosphodiesterase membrane domain-containing protein n=1 Tax=Streptomyces sp. NPDC053431 TaxID=3365703 RepID=UPI0037D4E98D
MNDTPGWASPGSAPSDDQDGQGVPRPASPGDANGSAPQWSKDQPPAGQWQPPTAPVHGAPPATPARADSGSHSQAAPGPWGQQHGQWGPAPAAKPGVIPLRPLTIGDILDGSVATLRRYWQTVLTVSVTVAVVMQVAEILAQRYLIPAPPQINPDASPAEALSQSVDAMQSSLIAMGPAYLIMVAATLVSAALLTVVISRAVLGRPVTLGTAWQEARPRLLQLLGLTLLVPLMAAGIMFVGLLPGLLLGGNSGVGLAFLGGTCAFAAVVWLTIRFSLASPALMLERQGVMKALKRSAKLVQGSWWRIFGINMLTQLLIFLFSMLIAFPFAFLAMGVAGDGIGDILDGTISETSWSYLIVMGIGGVVTSAITYPISAGVTVLLYIDQRIRREALDLELARAAGLPGYGG